MPFRFMRPGGAAEQVGVATQAAADLAAHHGTSSHLPAPSVNPPGTGLAAPVMGDPDVMQPAAMDGGFLPPVPGARGRALSTVQDTQAQALQRGQGYGNRQDVRQLASLQSAIGLQAPVVPAQQAQRRGDAARVQEVLAANQAQPMPSRQAEAFLNWEVAGMVKPDSRQEQVLAGLARRMSAHPTTFSIGA